MLEYQYDDPPPKEDFMFKRVDKNKWYAYERKSFLGIKYWSKIWLHFNGEKYCRSYFLSYSEALLYVAETKLDKKFMPESIILSAEELKKQVVSI